MLVVVSTGAAVMASERVGAAAAAVKIKSPRADYFHCCMFHCFHFNLFVSRSLKIPELMHCLDCTQKTMSFFNYSAKRVLCLVKLRTPKSKRTRLVTLCSTRFVDRHTAVHIGVQGTAFIHCGGTTKVYEEYGLGSSSQLLHSLLNTSIYCGIYCGERYRLDATCITASTESWKWLNRCITARWSVAVLSQWRNRATAKFAQLFQLGEELCQKLDVNLTEL